MQLISRSAWSARPSKTPVPALPSARGVKVHYLGTEYTAGDHATCAAYMRKVQAGHLANTAENYSDIAYNFAVCEHGCVYEGRGLKKRPGANGNATLNRQHYAILAFVGSAGHTMPTVAQVKGIRDAIAYLRKNGAGREIRGHRDGHATACPGGPLYAMVKSGQLEPGTHQSFPGADWFKKAPKSAIVTAMGRRLVAEGCSAYSQGPGPQWTDADRQSYAKWQRKCGFTGADADGWPGKTSWDKLSVPKG